MRETTKQAWKSVQSALLAIVAAPIVTLLNAALCTGGWTGLGEDDGHDETHLFDQRRDK